MSFKGELLFFIEKTSYNSTEKKNFLFTAAMDQEKNTPALKSFPDCFKYSSTKKHTVYATEKAIKEDEALLTKATEVHRQIQNVVAIASLKEVLVITLTFKYAYMSWFEKGDDLLIFEKIKYSIGQCSQAGENQIVAVGYPLADLVNQCPTIFQLFFNEIMGHFRVVLETIYECISGRNETTSSIEFISQTWKWSTWKQIGTAALSPLSSIDSVVSLAENKYKNEPSVKENLGLLYELCRIANCFRQIIGCFLIEKYPHSGILLETFQSDPIIKKDYIDKLEISDPGVVKKGFVTSLFSGLI